MYWFKVRSGFCALLLMCVAGSFCLDAAVVQSAGSHHRQFPIGSVSQPQDLPPGSFRTRLEQLNPASQERALGWLRSFHFTDQDLPSLRMDANGGILYACFLDSAETELEPPQVSAAAVPVSPFPANLKFHSRPGAPNTLFLNFSGETVVNTDWNTELGRTEIPAVAFSADTDFSTFSDAEQLTIKRVWQRVAEDYAPFNIDVTTERPATFTTRTAHALITRSTDANGDLNPSADSAAGIAYVNVFGTFTYARYRPAWIYYNKLSNREAYIAEAASHEVGHNLGLSHDGTTDGTEYYAGHGSGDISWAPIMGSGYTRNVSQWSKGEYYLANNTQDDLVTIAGKVSYRADDRGSMAAAATALLLTGGTNVIATTPETDPASTNTANKGVLERNTDVDVFSFVTGDGPISLSVSPWVTPSGTTRGGNLDLRLELYSMTGVLLATNNPPFLTSAEIKTNLPQGRYYLYVSNSGAGDPLTSSPSGYTAYASLGQYFIHGYVVAAPGFIPPPVAELQVTDLVQPGISAKQFTVTYTDDVAVDVSTLDSTDLRITGPNGYDRAASFVNVNSTSDGTPRTATYAATPPDGVSWQHADNGTYSIWMQTNQVGDTEGAWVSPGKLGQFKVLVPVPTYSANMTSDPGWTLDPEWEYGTPGYTLGGPTAGYTGSNIIGYNLDGDYANRLTMTYATTPAIDCSDSLSVTLRFRRWLRLRSGDTAAIEVSTNGATWLNVWSTSSAVSDASWQEVLYTLPAGVAGSSTVRLRWGLASNISQTDIGWNIDDVEILGDGSLDTSPPIPVLNVTDLTSGGSPSHNCTVTYTDDNAVRIASLDSTDLYVTGPNGYSNLVEFAGADLPLDGSPCTGTYSISAPGGTWDASDNGVYQLVLRENEVEDIFNNATPLTALGTFTVTLAINPGLLSVSPLEVFEAFGTSGGPFSPEATTYTLSNSGGQTLDWAASNGQSWLSLSATNGALPPGASAILTLSLNNHANTLEVGKYTDLVSFINLTTGDGNTARAVTLSVVAPGLLAVSPVEALAASGPVGGPFDPGATTFALTNTGGASFDWLATNSQEWVSLSATGGTLAPGESTNVAVSLNTSANALAAGTYTDLVLFTNLTTGNGSSSREVNLTVFAPGLLDVTPVDGLAASGLAGGPFNPGAITFTLSNAGGASFDWLATNSQHWVSLSATGGTLAPGESTNVTVSLNTSAEALTAGSYTDLVSFVNTSTGRGNTTREVNLAILAAPGELVVLPEDNFVSSGNAGGPFAPESTVYTLTNAGGTVLAWVCTKSADWLEVSAEGGTLAPGESTNVLVFFTTNAASLAPAEYTATVTFDNLSSDTSGSSRAVSLTVNALVTVALTASVNNPGWGMVTPSNGTYTVGSSVEVLASPAPYFEFQEWSGTATGTNNPLTLLLQNDQTVLALFCEIFTTNYPTPYWWLAENGYTNDFEGAVSILGSNGIPVWQSYIAGLDPNDPQSQLRLAGEMSADGTVHLLTWNPVPDRLYTLWWSTNAVESYTPVPEATNLPATVSSFTNAVVNVGTALFYRVEVRKE